MSEWNVIDEWVARIGSMERLGASLEELAKETIESIMGFDGQGGHKPPRADIQKMKDAYDLYWRAYNPGNALMDFQRSEIAENDDEFNDAVAAHHEWQEKYRLTHREAMIVQMYQHVLRYGDARNNPQKAFEYVARVLSGSYNNFDADAHEQAAGGDFGTDRAYEGVEPTPEAKREVGTALKKFEQQHYPTLYKIIENALDDAYRRGLESYKLWPRMVTWIKDYYQQFLLGSAEVNKPAKAWEPYPSAVKHMLDIVTEGGKILDQLRRENRLPRGFDINKVSFDDFENWLMEWKRENLGSEHAGEVVYEFKDGWTIQKLTTPEQLQFEGDEMGHCVGGYAHSVGAGEDIIYSLRDPKSMPHVTMEIKALEGPENLGGWSADELPEDAIFNHSYIHPDAHAPGDHFEEMVDREHRTVKYKPTGETPFEVVQVMGNSNKTPKPEYQRKIKEFLDYLRSKGWKFVRSDEWFAPFDDPQQSEYGEGAPDTARELDDWYDDHYKTHHEAYRGVSEGDAYGLPAERATLGVSDWSALFEDCLHSLIDEYDPGRWSGNWRDLAQAVWHAWTIDIYKDHLDPDALEKHKQNLLDEIQKGEETLWEWEDQQWFYASEHNKDVIAEQFQEIAEKKGVWPQIEQKLNAEYGEDMWNEDEIYNEGQDLDEDVWTEANDAVREKELEYYSGDAHKFCQYLYMLAEKNGVVNPQDLPDPNERHGGLPSYEELQEMPWKHDDFEQNEHPMGNLNLPGALSKVAMALRPEQLQEWITEHGPYAWHETRSEYLPSILKNGLHPWDEGGEPQYKHKEYVSPRPGAIYMWLDPNERPIRGDAVLRIDLRQLDPTRFVSDEDSILNWPAHQDPWGAKWTEHPDGEWDDTPWGNQHGYFDENMDEWYQHSKGEFADMHAEVVDQPDALLDGMNWNKTVAYKGTIPPSAITVENSHTSATHPIEIYPIDHEHNVWFDTDGNQRQRYRPGWAKNPETGRMEQTGELEDTFLDKHGRQGQGWVAYNDDVPVGSLTYVDDQGWHMIGTAYTHPDFREQGIFNRLVAPLRETGRPIDAYVWENPWLKQKVRSWR